MIQNCNTQNPLLRDGTSQQQRLLKALLPAYVSVDERSMQDLMDFAMKLGPEINYYDGSNTPQGNWQPFFKDQVVDEATQSTQPHYALFMAFLQIFKYAQEDLNTITARHLDFYYKEVLNLKERAGIPDQVFVIFNLAQEVAMHAVAGGTRLDGKKDSTGVDLVYETENSIVVNTAQVTDLKSLFYNKKYDKRVYASPVANSADGNGAEFEGDTVWRTFGAISDPTAPFSSPLADRPQARLGFAFASPVLVLSEGVRTVTFTLSVNNIGSVTTGDILNAFNVVFSGEKDWIVPSNESNGTYVNGNTIVLRRMIDITQPPVVPYNQEVLGDPFTTSWPVAKITLNTSDSSSPYVYEKLKSLVIMSADITVDVAGVKNLIVQSDSSILDASKPFQPFGSRPVIGSSLFIGNSEVFSKTLSSIDLDITWKGLPTEANGFKDHYQHYIPALENSKRTNDNFRATISVLQNRGWKVVVPSYADNARLFNSQVSVSPADFDSDVMSAVQEHITPVTPNSALRRAIAQTPDVTSASFDNAPVKSGEFDGDFSVFQTANTGEVRKKPQILVTYAALLDKRRISISGGELTSVPRDPKLSGTELAELDNTTQRGFLRLDLAEIDFGHQAFQNSFTVQALKAATRPANKTVDDYPLPNEPYTPVISDLSINYSSTVTLQLVNTPTVNSLTGFNSRVDQFFHVEPFGVAENHPFITKNTPSMTVVPVFNDEGSLFVGLSGLKPAQIVSVLFKVSDGTSNPDLLEQKVNWSYMVDNEWRPFEPLKIVSDTTHNFLKSGIVVFDVSKFATSNNTLLPAGLHWLKASVTDDSLATCSMIDVRAQAVEAVFTDNGNDPAHLYAGLAPETIKSLVTGDAAIAKVEQPYASFGGRMPEQSAEFYVRVSERLRHKQRAVCLWDYEHLILQRFPTVYKVKCLNHARVISNDDIREVVPGCVSVIIVPNIQNKGAVNPLKPKTSLILLNEIEDYMTAISPPAVSLYIKNPFYEEVSVSFKVRFAPGYDTGFYSQQLNEEIKQFLAPWAYGGSDVSFGGAIHRSVIINFVEERPYVDFVTCFKMNHIIGNDTLLDVEQAMAKTSASIITSAAMHDIGVIAEGEECDCDDNIANAPFGPVDDDCSCEHKLDPDSRGIGAFRIGDNFIIDSPDGSFSDPSNKIGGFTIGSGSIQH